MWVLNGCNEWISYNITNYPTTAQSIYTPYNEEIVVESSLNIVKKGSEAVRQKRQFGGGFGG